MADALLRGKAVAENFGTDLLSVDYHAIAGQSLDDVRALLHMPPKGHAATAAGSPSINDLEGMSASQRAVYEANGWDKK